MATDNGLLFPPGTAWSYSNTNYVVLGLLIERVTGTTVALPPPRLHAPGPHRAPGRRRLTWFNPSLFWASGALVSNVDDLDRFYDALFDGRLLPGQLLAEMLTPAEASAAARANPGTTAGVIRFR